MAQALALEKHSGMFSRKPYYELPASLTEEQLTLMLQQPLTLHDMQVSHVVIARDALEQWLLKGGDRRGKLNGIGFAQTLDLLVNAQHCITWSASKQACRM